MDLKNTQTEKNLQKALAGESIARNKYTVTVNPIAIHTNNGGNIE